MGVDLLNPGASHYSRSLGRIQVDRTLHHGRPDRGFDERPQRGLLARRPDHYKQFTIVGILLMALDGRPLLGRRLKGKSRRELRDLGRTVPGTDAEPATQTERR
jgi:hypothetical protein